MRRPQSVAAGALFAVIASALVVVAGAQEPAPPPQAPAPGEAAQVPAGPPEVDADGQPIFRTGINFVRVDVIATDRSGAPVVDLTKDDFEVFEDNKPQAVETFRLVRIDPVASEYATRGIRTREDEETAAADENARIFVFFLDDYHVRLGSSMASRRALADFVRTALAPGDLVAVMYPLTPLDAVVLTRNHESVARTIDQFEGRKFNYEPRNSVEHQYAHQPTEVVERLRRQVSLSALRGLSIKLGALREGRKAVVLLSEGYTALLPPQMRDMSAAMPGFGNRSRNNPLAGENNPNEERARNLAEFDMQRELQDVFDAANRANTSIYAVDPRGLSTGEFDIADNIGIRQSQEALRSTMASIQMLAENTDGRAIVNSNDLARGLQQIVRDSSAYYLLGYNSTPAPQDGKFHAIRVRAKRPGVQIRARKGYWALTAEETTRAVAPPKAAGPPPEVARAIASIAPASGRRLVRTWVGTAPGEEGRTRVTFVWEPIPPTPGVRREEPAQVRLVATSAGGDEVFSGGVPAAAQGGASVSFDAPPGRLRLRMAVEGESGDGAPLDTEERDLTVPDLTSTDVTLGTPRLFVARNAREFQQIKADPSPTPAAAREFRRTQRLLVRVDAFGRPGSPVTVTARLLNRQGQPMADVPVAASESAGEPYVVDLPLASLAAGEYLLELSAAAEGHDPATELVAFRLTS